MNQNDFLFKKRHRRRGWLTAVLTAALVLSGCGDSQTAETPLIEDIEITSEISEIQSSEQTTEKSITTSVEQVTSSESTEEIETLAISETKSETGSDVETVTIAGQEFSVDETAVSILITDDSEPVTDISELSKLKNLKTLVFNYITEGGYNRRIDGLKALEGSESLEDIGLSVGLANEKDIHILETMPNLESLRLYSVYEDFEFNIPSLKYLYLMDTYDLSRIEHLTGLESLTLVYNNSDDLSPISKLKNLKILHIEECFFEDYSSILELEDLSNLWISSEPMTREMYDKICEKFPDCNITIINDFID